MPVRWTWQRVGKYRRNPNSSSNSISEQVHAFGLDMQLWLSRVRIQQHQVLGTARTTNYRWATSFSTRIAIRMPIQVYSSVMIFSMNSICLPQALHSNGFVSARTPEMRKLDPLPGKDLERGKQEPVGKNLQGSRLTQFNGQSDPHTHRHISYSAIHCQSSTSLTRRVHS